MLTGQFNHQLDEKNRFRIPAKLKKALGDNPLITRGSSGCLFLFPASEAERIFDSYFGGDHLADNKNTRALRFMASSAFTVEEDSHGRVLLPQNLIKAAGITKNIVIIGAGKRAEIWSEERWEEYNNSDGELSYDDCLKSMDRQKLLEEHGKQ